MNAGKEQGHWLARYASGYHTWTESDESGSTIYKRPIGLVERAFDIDGVHYGGRADLHNFLTLNARVRLTDEEFRRHVVLAWTCFQLSHVLLLASVEGVSGREQRCFVVRVPKTTSQAVAESRQSIIFLQDYYSDVDADLLFEHGINNGRNIKPDKSLSKALVLPLKGVKDGIIELRIILYVAHQISDGLTMQNWASHLIDLLNKPSEELESNLQELIDVRNVAARLPSPQEDVYPRNSGTRAAQRWFWVIMRILRHVRKPLPLAFENPLRFARRPPSDLPLEPRFAEVFNYRREDQPPLHTGSLAAQLSLAATQRLVQLCRAAGASVGAGCFALVAMVMMQLYDERYPELPLAARKPFIASFPLNPRPFLAYSGPADSCMLAFSDGLVLPYLPSHLDLERRFVFLAKRAHRELGSYQKRLRDGPPASGADHRAPLRIAAETYLAMTERVETKVPGAQDSGARDVQGAYPPRAVGGTATCGVSSIGSVKEWSRPGKYLLDDDSTRGKELVADFRSARIGVRAREDEFLVGVMSDAEDRIAVAVSYDATAMDQERVARWADLIVSILEPRAGEVAKL